MREGMPMRLHHVRGGPRARTEALMCLALLAAFSTADAAPLVRPLAAIAGTATSGDGEARVIVRRRGRALDGVLIVTVRHLTPSTPYEIVVDGVRIGTIETDDTGAGRATFRTRARGRSQLLGVDPRGKGIAVHALD